MFDYKSIITFITTAVNGLNSYNDRKENAYAKRVCKN